MSKTEWGVVFLFAGVVLMALSALWHLYVIFTESHALNRFRNDKTMLGVAITLFFSFSLSLYWFCPNARKKGIVFVLLACSGVVLYALASVYLAPYMMKR